MLHTQQHALVSHRLAGLHRATIAELERLHDDLDSEKEARLQVGTGPAAVSYQRAMRPDYRHGGSGDQTRRRTGALSYIYI